LDRGPSPQPERQDLEEGPARALLGRPRPPSELATPPAFAHLALTVRAKGANGVKSGVGAAGSAGARVSGNRSAAIRGAVRGLTGGSTSMRDVPSAVTDH